MKAKKKSRAPHKKKAKKIGGSRRTAAAKQSVNAYTEADVERLVIDKLLTGSNFLEIPTTQIQGKKYLAPAPIDKAAGKAAGYYPDFSVWETAFPVLIVEAKAPDVDVEVGYREAGLYARHINLKYRTGINPCHFIIACNGVELLAGPWDSKPSLRLQVADLLPSSTQTEDLRAFCHHRVLTEHAARAWR